MNNDPSSNSHEDFLDEVRIFVRKARDAAHQALFFLGLVHKTSCKKADGLIKDHYLGFALTQVRHLAAEIKVPSYSGEAPNQLDQELAPNNWHDIRKAIETWESITELLTNGQAVDFDQSASLRRHFRGFLKASRSTGISSRFGQQVIPDILKILYKNLTQVIALAIVLFVLTKVEAVYSLWRNAGWMALLPALGVLIPLMVTRGLIMVQRCRRPGVVFWWDIGGPPFRSLFYVAVEPGRGIRRWPSKEPEKVPLLKALRIWLGRLCQPESMLDAVVSGQLLRLLIYLLLWIAVVMAVAFIPDAFIPGTWPTLILIYSLLYALLVTSYFIDFWEFLDPSPVRFLSLLAGLGLGFLALGGADWLVLTLLWIAVPSFLLYYYFDFRKGKDRPLRVVLAVVVAIVATIDLLGYLSYRAEIWPQESWESMTLLDEDQWPHAGEEPVVVMAASGGGSRAAIYTGLTLASLHEDHQEIADNLQAISSVSGGSLASAVYLARRYRDLPIGREELTDGLARDFLEPTIFGVLKPWSSRGAEIESYWAKELGLGPVTLGTLARSWREAARNEYPPFPIPLFNSSTLDGHDVVLSPLASDLYTRHEVRPSVLRTKDLYTESRDRCSECEDDSTWVYYRDGIYGLEDLIGPAAVPLNKVVRASANFPFGFPLVRVAVPAENLTMSPLRPDDRREIVELTDGGALSNSGMWSLFQLLTSKKVRPELERRGVLLIVVDASKMPEYSPATGSERALMGTIGDQSPIGQYLHRSMFDLLEHEYGERLAVVQIDLLPLERYNVFTTWALDSNTKKRLECVFSKQWREAQPRLIDRWNHLKSLPPLPSMPPLLPSVCPSPLLECPPSPGTKLADRDRPPLD